MRKRLRGLAGWARRRSLRARLTAAAVVVIAGAMTLAALLLVIRLQAALLDGVDEVAEDRAERIASAMADGRSSDALLGADDDEEVVQVVAADGALLAASVRLPSGEPVLAPAAGPGATTVDGLPLAGERDERFRVVTVPVPGADGDRRLVQVAVALDDADEAVDELVTALAVGVPLVVAVLGGLTWMLAGRALRPVEVLRRQVAGIPGDALDRRVTVPPSSDELARLAVTFNGLLARAEAATRRQQEFVADAAHEVRSPLASLRTQLEVAALHGDDRWRQQLPAMAGDAQRLSRLVDDLLRLARLDARVPLVRSAVDLDEIVLEAAARLSGDDGARLDISGVSGARVPGDADALTRVVHNLLENALRHARTTVTVTLNATDRAVLTVADDGPGIPPDQRDRVFERFTRLDEARTRDAGGTGLGLAIVRDVVTRHGGTVAVEDAGPGARFLVSLPLAGEPR